VRVRVKTLALVCIFAAAGAGLVMPVPQAAIEGWYSGSFYPPLQRVLTSLSNLTPFAWLDVLLIGFPIVWCAVIVRDVRRSDHRARAVGRWALRTAAAAASFYVLFLVAWGMNYRRLPLEKKLRYDAAAVTADAARDAAQLSVLRLNALFVRAHATGPANPDGNVDASLVLAFARTMKDLGASGTTVPARPKRTLLDLYFRSAAVAGMTDPFFLETLVESDLLPVERPFVIAHEWSHLAGFADEGEANFAGFLVCSRADAPTQYSGWLFLFGELVNSLPRNTRADVIGRLDSGPRDDLRAIAQRLARDVRPRVSAVGWRVYDRYLKANRVEAGAASYAQVVRLVLGTRLGLTADESASPVR
jgi:hypothetical protein